MACFSLSLSSISVMPSGHSARKVMPRASASARQSSRHSSTMPLQLMRVEVEAEVLA